MVFGHFAVYKSDIDVCTISHNEGFPSQVLRNSCLYTVCMIKVTKFGEDWLNGF